MDGPLETAIDVQLLTHTPDPVRVMPPYVPEPGEHDLEPTSNPGVWTVPVVIR